MHSNFSSWRGLSRAQMTLTATPHPREVKRELQSPLLTPVATPHTLWFKPWDRTPHPQNHTILRFSWRARVQVSSWCLAKKSKRIGQNLENMDKPWSSAAGLKSECAGQFFSRASLFVTPYWWVTIIAKQLSMATIPLCFGFFRCHVDVLQR